MASFIFSFSKYHTYLGYPNGLDPNKKLLNLNGQNSKKLNKIKLANYITDENARNQNEPKQTGPRIRSTMLESVI